MSAIVLANLCVSYIMTSQNEEAEELMRKIEKEQLKKNRGYFWSTKKSSTTDSMKPQWFSDATEVFLDATSVVFRCRCSGF